MNRRSCPPASADPFGNKHLLALTLWFAAALMLPREATAQQTPLSCFTTLAIPSYHTLARQAGLTGRFELDLVADRQGKINVERTYSEHDYLMRAVVQAMGKSKVRPDCAGTPIRLVFDFRLDKSAVDTEVILESPNVFRISAPPAPLNVALVPSLLCSNGRVGATCGKLGLVARTGPPPREVVKTDSAGARTAGRSLEVRD